MIQPYPWQEPSVEEMVRILSTQQFALNASETGTGKTVTALETIKRLQFPSLIICPKQVHTAWLRTADDMQCANLITGVVNAEKLQFKNKFFSGNKWDLSPGTLIVWDEVHRGASGPKSKTTKILAYTRPQGFKVLAMSATIASSPLQMRAVGYLAGMHQFRDDSYWPWCLQNGCFRMPNIQGLHFPKGPRGKQLMAQLGIQLRPFMTRICIEDVPEFPETQILANLYDLDEEYTDAINAAYKQLAEEIKSAKGNPLIERLRARQTTELAKVWLLKDLAVEEWNNDKSVVLFVNFRDTMIKLHHAICMHVPDHRVATIFGGQKDDERQMIIDRFRNDDLHILICMAQAGGVGISLHGAPNRRHRVSLLTPGDRAVDFQQCLGRIHRSGGTKTVQTLVLAAGTVEEKVHSNLRDKLGNLQALTDKDFSLTEI